jgi:alkylhydroperoxidase family enzyme
MTIRLFAVAAWRQALPFTGDARAALALAEAVTRLSDRVDPVPDAIWDEVARHYDEPALATLVITIATINAWNRLNVTTRQVGDVLPCHRRDLLEQPGALGVSHGFFVHQ